MDAFSIKIFSNDTVDELKDLIKTKNPDTFNGIDAKKLTLWRVLLPITDEDDEIPILLNNVTSDKKKLSPATRLSKVFPEEIPEEMVHIIVQRPPPELDLPSNKRIRITEGWKQYTASDGK
ncbi:hypothetical protein CPC16_005346, partial [Podila verticillata]